MSKTAGSKKRESKIQEDVIEYLTSRGAYVVKIHVGSYQTQGVSDIVCCYRGRYIALELKRPNEEPTRLQEYRIEQTINAGGIAKVVSSVEEVKEVLYDIDTVQWNSKPL